MRAQWFKFLLVLLALSLFCSNVAQADELYARIRGTITDPSGAVLPGVQLVATNVGTGVTRTVNTNNEGFFEFLALQPGKYTVVASKPGFKTATTSNILLRVNDVYVNNLTMQVGAVTEQVTVEANPAQVEATSMQLTATLSATAVNTLPLNGRNWITLQQTLPGVVLPEGRFGTNYATNGAQGQQNSYLVNGTDSNDLPLNTPLAPPNPDAIAEVKMVTNTINPEYGRNSGAIMNAITKSGTNSFHGSAFEFYRDTFLNTKNFFQKDPSKFHQNQFGGTVGGPIFKNKTFFFFAFQGTRARQPSTNLPGLPTVYSAAQLAGDFSGSTLSANTNPFPVTGSNGTVYPAGTPWTTIFPTGQVPTSNFNPLSVQLVKQFVPLPNFTNNQYSYQPIVQVKTNQYIGRLDQTFSSKDSVWFYALANNQSTLDDLPFTGATLPGFGQQSTPITKQFTTAWTHTFTPEMLSELRLGYTRLNFVTVYPQKVVQPKDVGFPNIIPQIAAGASYPTMAVTGYFTLGFSTNGPQPRKDQTYQLTENFSWIKGKHSLKFGYEGRKFQVWNPFGARNSGLFTFDSSGTYSTGDPGLDFLLGIPQGYNQQSGQLIIAQAYQHYMFAQDLWKVRNNLTLTLGLGYQIDDPIRELQNNGLSRSCFFPGQQSKIYPTAPVGMNFPGDVGCNDAGGFSTKYTHLGPRLGFAYQPNWGWLTGEGKSSIRGGFGIYYNRSEEELNLQDLGIPPFGTVSTGVGDIALDPSFPNPWVDIAGGGSETNKFPYVAPAPGSVVDFTQFYPFGYNFSLATDNTVPYAMNYNLTFERELPSQTILRLGYVGSQGRKLVISRSFNPATPQGVAACLADPNNRSKGGKGGCADSPSAHTVRFPDHFTYPGNIWGNSGFQYNGGNSNYNSLQIAVEKRITHGLSAQTSYTWSHSLDQGSSFEDVAFLASGGFDAYGNLAHDYGDSAFDARHRWVLTFSYDIPNLNKLSAFSWMPSRLFGGWRITGINAIQTGFPIQFQDSKNRSLTCSTVYSFYSCPDRPDYVSMPVALDPRTATIGTKTNYFFDPANFKDNALGTQGNIRRGFMHGPSFWNTDFAVHKDITISEQRLFQLRLEVFNLFNHTNFANPTGNFNSGNFGRVTAIRANTNSRLVQLGARFEF